MQEYKKIDIGIDDIIPTAERMKSEKRQLVMIHGHLDDDDAPVICYDYEVGSIVESYTIKGISKLPTISAIYDVAASWPERELNELLGIEFEGLDTSERLFLPQDMLSGQGQIIVSPLPKLRDKAHKKKEE